MNKGKAKKILGILFKYCCLAAYLVCIAVLVTQGLTPGSESSKLSSSVGDQINDIVSGVHKPEAEIIDVTGVKANSVAGVAVAEGTVFTFNDGDSVTASFSVLPANATNKSLNYTSSDDSVATIDASGMITCISPGLCEITATSAQNSDFTASVAIEVQEVLIESIEVIAPSEIQLGESRVADVKYTPRGTTNKKVSWSSSDESVISVNEKGKITGLKLGSATITATYIFENGDGSEPAITSSATITVIPVPEEAPINAILIDQSIAQASVKDTIKLTVTATSDKQIPNYKNVIWYSSDKTVASVTQNGSVTFKSTGTVVITAKESSSSDIKSSITITVIERMPTEITILIRVDEKGEFEPLTDKKYSIKEGEGFKIRAEIDDEATARNIQYKTSSSKIATVGKDGVVTATGAGNVVITAFVQDGDKIMETSMELTVDALTLKDTVSNFYFIIRKSIGHFGAFFVMGICAAFTHILFSTKSKLAKAMSFILCLVSGFTIAGVTEICQLPMFTEGRTCAFKDVIIDLSGFAASTVIVYVVFAIYALIAALVSKFKKPKLQPIPTLQPAISDATVEEGQGQQDIASNGKIIESPLGRMTNKKE